MIEIRDLSVSFGGVRALDGLSAKLDDPIVGVIGPNGAGKTTLLNAFSGFVPVASGSLTAFGTDLLAMAPHRRARWGLRRSFQTEEVVDDLTVADNVRVMLDALTMKPREKTAAVERALAFVGLADQGRQLCAGMDLYRRRQVEIAKIVAGSPKVVLLDEPAAGLQPNEAAALRDILVAIPETCGARVVLIDHDVDLIAAICRSTLVLDFGRRLAFGPTGEVLRDPKVKAAYLGLEEAA